MSIRIASIRARLLAGGVLALTLATVPAGVRGRQQCLSAPVIRAGGVQNVGHSFTGGLSSDGRYLAFLSHAFDGTPLQDDVFVYDRLTCALELISVSSDETPANDRSFGPSISGDGRYVAFASMATNLVAFDANGSTFDAYVRDRQLGTTTLISVDSAQNQPAMETWSVKIARDGHAAVFSSFAALVPDDTNGMSDVFVRNLTAGTTERVSVSSPGDQTNGHSGQASTSNDGRFVVFASDATNLVPNDTNNGADIFVRDRLLNTTVRASLDATGSQVNSFAVTPPAITGDGRLVFFAYPVNLIPSDPTCDGIFIRDLVLNETSCPTLDPANATTAQQARYPVASDDGRYLAFLSSATHYVANSSGTTQMFVHDRATGSIQKASTTVSGVEANQFVREEIALSGDGRVVAYGSLATNLVTPDGSSSYDVFVADWAELSWPAEVELTRNGSFTGGAQWWQTFATPDSSYLVTDTTAGELRFYREPPPPGTSNQAVVFQQTRTRVLAHQPVEARFRLGNSSSVRKRISVLLHDADFSDLVVCTFWLAANAPMNNYAMRSHTTRIWANTTISFYAATPGSDGGFYRVDDVSVKFRPVLDDDVTDCVDPTAPVAPGGAPGPTLLTNGDFSAGVAPWTTFGQITWRIASSVFEFVRPPGTPAGVVFQPTGQALAPNDILTAQLYLGNSSPVRKRVTVILHDSDFSDLSACTFWLAPQAPLAPYLMRTFTTKGWGNTTISVYPSTVGPDEWIRLTDVVLQATPAAAPLGTECLEPGADSVMLMARGLARPVGPFGRTREAATRAEPVEPILTAYASTPGPRTVWQRTLDLGAIASPTLSFESSFEGTESTGLAQVSLDGVNWVTLTVVEALPGWATVDLDLSAYAGAVVHVRLVFDAAAGPPGLPPDRWRVRQFRVHQERSP